MFRAHGLLAPVWDLAPGTGAEVLEEPAAVFADALAEALARRLGADRRPSAPPAPAWPTGRSRSAETESDAVATPRPRFRLPEALTLA